MLKNKSREYVRFVKNKNEPTALSGYRINMITIPHRLLLPGICRRRTAQKLHAGCPKKPQGGSGIRNPTAAPQIAWMKTAGARFSCRTFSRMAPVCLKCQFPKSQAPGLSGIFLCFVFIAQGGQFYQKNSRVSPPFARCHKGRESAQWSSISSERLPGTRHGANPPPCCNESGIHPKYPQNEPRASSPAPRKIPALPPLVIQIPKLHWFTLLYIGKKTGYDCERKAARSVS